MGCILRLSGVNIALKHLILELHYFALVTFPETIVLNRVVKIILIRGHGLAVRWAPKI